METNDISKHLVFDSKLQDDLFELNVEAISSHVRAHTIFSDHSFDFNSLIEKL